MSDFSSATATTQKDPSKRVRYSHGLVLGVDDFEQEQFYFLEQGRRHNRRLHGYGQVCGLNVSIAGDEVTITKGLALSPKGALIRISEDQCGDLGDWLSANGGSPAAPVYIKLCHLECDTDSVPVPGAPCRDEEDSVAPSRITESFSLNFSTTPPEQTEHLALTRLGDLLARFEVSEDAASPALDVDGLPDLLQSVVDDDADTDPIPVQVSDIEALLDALLRLWTTVYQPKLPANGAACSGDAPDEDCILLATLVEQGGGYAVALDQRPHLLSTRLLQELLLHMPGLSSPDQVTSAVGGDLRGSLPAPEVDGIIGFPIDDAIPPVEGQVLRFDGDTSQWRSAGLTVESLDNVAAVSPGDGQALIYSGGLWRASVIPTGPIGGPPTGPASGDLRGSYPGPRVDGLQGRPVVNTAPNNNDVLTWNGSQWAPKAPTSTPAPTVNRVLPFAEISYAVVNELERQGFEVWFHVDAQPNDVEVILGEFEGGVEILVETGSQPFLAPISQVDKPQHRFRNLFFLSPDLKELRGHAEEPVVLLRFVFNLARININEPNGAGTLKEWVDNTGIAFDGYDPEQGTVTKFLRLGAEISQGFRSTLNPSGTILGATGAGNFDVSGGRVPDAGSVTDRRRVTHGGDNK